MNIAEKLLAIDANTDRIEALNLELERILEGKTVALPTYDVLIMDTSDPATWEEEIVSYSIDGGNTFIPIKSAETHLSNVSTIEFRAAGDYGGYLVLNGEDEIWNVDTYNRCVVDLTQNSTFELYVSW